MRAIIRLDPFCVDIDFKRFSQPLVDAELAGALSKGFPEKK